MGRRQIVDVDVIANAGAVGRGIVVAENRDVFALPERHLQHDRNQVRLGRVVLAHVALRARAGGVEVTQRRVAQAVGRGVIGQRLLDDQLGEAVRIDRPLRLFLGDRHSLRRAVGGRGAGKDDLLDVRGPHGFQQPQAADDVVLIILGRIVDRFADQRERREVHHRVDLLFAQHAATAVRDSTARLRSAGPAGTATRWPSDKLS